MAEVYLAKCFGVAGFERLVALKRILPTIAEDDEFIAMFIDEAKIAGQLSHPNVAQIFDLGKINASYFIAMEYISGHDLRALWDRANDDGGLPLALSCHVVRKICEGLDYAHRRRDNRGRPLGIIHRDVSPQNILLSYDGDTKVIDFGIAKAANRMVRTQTGILKGKFAYMAPEQARGEPTDHRADIFAIGVILYELITGERCFKAESDFALLEKVRRVDIVAPRKIRPDIPRDLERIVFKALSREAGDRYAWASALAADLDHFMSDQDFTYNKVELGAYVRRMFRDENNEEARRLAQYRSFKVREDADGEEELYAEEIPSEEESLTNSGADDDQRTYVAQDPSNSSAQQVPNETLVGDPIESDYYDEDSIDGQPTAQFAGDKLRALGPAASSIVDSDVDASMTIPGGELDINSSLLLGSSTSAPNRGETAQAASRSSLPSDKTMVEESIPNSLRAPDSMRSSAAPASTSVPSSIGSVLGSETGGSSGHRPATRPRLSTTPRSLTPRSASGRGSGNHGHPTSDASESSPLAPSSGMLSATDAYGAVDEFSSPPPAPPAATKVGTVAAASVFFGLIFGAAITGVAMWLGQPAAPDVVITSEPLGASVKLGDELVCERTPCVASLGTGKHVLAFKLGKAAPVKHTVEVRRGAFDIAGVVLSEKKVALKIDTEPSEARVTLNNVVISGKTPLTLPSLAVGEKISLKIQRKGYSTIEEIFVVPPTSTGLGRMTLKATHTRWTITATPTDAIVIPAGNRWGFRKKAAVEVRRDDAHAVRIMRPGCEPQFISLIGNGRAEGKRSVNLKCKKADATLKVSAPRKAAILIDGVRFSARDARNYKIPAGTYGVVVSLRSKEEAQVLTLDAGKTTKASFFR